MSISLRYRHRSRIIGQIDVEDDRRYGCNINDRHLGVDPVDLDRDGDTPTGAQRAKLANDRPAAAAGALGGDHRNEGPAIG